MRIKLILAPEAEQDLFEAYNWYEEQQAGLGEEFFTCVDACIEAIRRTPEIYPIVYKTYRRGLVRRFPYAVFYEYDDKTVTVYSIFHASRDPEKWRRRLT